MLHPRSSLPVRRFVRALACSVVLLSVSANISCAQNDIRIFVDSTAQIVRGFGAANIVGWRPDMTDGEIETAFGVGDGQLGFSILRMRIPPQQGQWSVNLPTAQKAHAMGVTLIASPWSPPATMKTNNDLVGGELREESYDDYAAHLQAFNAYMAENGAPIYAISVQNEPDIQVTYESCDWTPGDMRQFMRENAPSIDTRIIAPESFQFRRQMSDPLLLDNVAAANLDIVGGHIYGGGLAPYPLAEEKGKELWMTEHLVLETDLNANLGTAVEIQNVMKAGMSAYLWWYIVRYYGPISDGMEGEYGKGEITKRGYVMSLFSRFIRPGAVRMHADESGAPAGVSLTAYRDTSRIVVVAVNSADVARDVSFRLDGGADGRFRGYVTSATQNVEELGDVEASEDRFTVSLGARSVTTFVSDPGVVSREVVTRPEQSHVLSPNYPNPFRSQTSLTYEMPNAGAVTLEVFDLLGRRMATLVDGVVPAGAHTVTVDASGWPVGTYVYRLRADGVLQTRPMTLVR